MKRVLGLLLAATLTVSLLPVRARAVNLDLNAKSALLMDVEIGRAHV